MSKNRIRITEAQLNNIIKRAITKSFIQEGIMDRLKGAYDGMKYEYNRVKDGNTPSDRNFRTDRNAISHYHFDIENTLYKVFVTLKKCNLQDIESMSNAINESIEHLMRISNIIKTKSARINTLFKYNGIQEGMMDKMKGAYYGMKDGFDLGRNRMNGIKQTSEAWFKRKDLLEKTVDEAYSLLTNCNCKDANNMRQTINRVEECLYGVIEPVGWIVNRSFR